MIRGRGERGEVGKNRDESWRNGFTDHNRRIYFYLGARSD